MITGREVEVSVIGMVQKKNKKKFDWETNDEKCVYNEIEDLNKLNWKINDNYNDNNNIRPKFPVQADEEKTKQYFENFIKNNNYINNEINHDIDFNKGLQRSLTQNAQERSRSPAINRVIRDSERDVNVDKNILKRNTINVAVLKNNNHNNINNKNNNNKITNNNLIEKNEIYNRKNENNAKTIEDKSKSFTANKSSSFNKNNINNNKIIISNHPGKASATNLTLHEENSNIKNKTSSELTSHNHNNPLVKKSIDNSPKKKNSFAASVANQYEISNNKQNKNQRNVNSFEEFNNNINNENTMNRNRAEISRSNSCVAINPLKNKNNAGRDLSATLSGKNSEINFANNSLKRSNSVFTKNDITLLKKKSSCKFLKKNSSSFLRSTLDDSVVNSKSKLVNITKSNSRLNNNKRNESSNADFSDYYENESGKEESFNQIRNKRSASQININKSKNYFFDYNNINNNHQQISANEENEFSNKCHNDIDDRSYKKNNNRFKFQNFDEDKIRYIMSINNKNNNNRNVNSTTKKTMKNYNLTNNNNNNFINNLKSAQIKFIDKKNNNKNSKQSEQKNFKTIQVIAPKVIVNVFRELSDSKELNELKPYKEKDYFEKFKNSIEFKLYLLKKFFILLLLEKFSDLDDKNFSDYCSNKNLKGLLNCDFTTNFSEYNILLNENHLENLTNYIIPKIKVLTNEILIFNRRTSAIYKHFVPLDPELHGIAYFLDGCRYIVANDKIYISGGRNEESYFSVFLEYDFINNTVKRLPDLRFARAYHKMLFCHNKQRIFFLGGESNQSCEFYDMFHAVCLPMPSLNEPRCYLNAYISCDGKRLYALFGIKGKILQSEFSEKVEVLDLEAYEKHMQSMLLQENSNNSSSQNFLYQMELKKKSLDGSAAGCESSSCNTIKISNVQSEIAKLTCDDLLGTKWHMIDYKNSGDIDLKFRYVGVYPLEKDVLLLIGGCLYREINLMITVFDIKKKEITKVDENIVSEIMRRAKDDAVLMKILAEINRNIYK